MLAAAAAIADQQIDVLAVQQRLRHLPAQVGEGAHVVPFAAVLRPGAHPVAGMQAGALGNAGGGRRPEHGLRFVDADPVRRGVEHDGEQQVRERPGDDDRGALPERLAVEGAAQLRGRHRRLALVEHAHVAAQRQGADDELGALRASPGGATRTRPKPIEKRSTRTPQATATR